MSLAPHGGEALTKAEDQDAISRLLQHGIAVIFFLNQRETGEIHGEGEGFYHCALLVLFRYLLEQGGGGRTDERTLSNPDVMGCSRLHYGNSRWTCAPCEKMS